MQIKKTQYSYEILVDKVSDDSSTKVVEVTEAQASYILALLEAVFTPFELTKL